MSYVFPCKQFLSSHTRIWRTIQLVCLLQLLPLSVHCQETGEYELKAMFLYNLTYFVNWPQSETDSSETFTIGIYGTDPFGSTLSQIVLGEIKNDKPVIVKNFKSLSDLSASTCDILYVTENSLDEWQKIYGVVKDQPVLTVSEVAGFPELGGMVSLVIVNQQVELEINHLVVRQAGLIISAKLLNIARTVKN